MLLNMSRHIAGNSRSTPRAARRSGKATPTASRGTLNTIAKELKAHAPFTILGALTGIVVMVVVVGAEVPRSFSAKLFWSLHPFHVLLSTWASLFHMTMALGKDVGPLTLAVIPVFLFLAVWIPCCTSDVVFPLLFSRDAVGGRG